MLTLTLALTANQPVEFHETGDFFRLMQATAAVTVQFYKDGRIIVDAADVGAGYAEKFGRDYDKFTLLSAGNQTVQFVSRLDSEVHYDAPPTGQVTVSGNVEVTNDVGNPLPVSQVNNGAFVQSRVSLTNAAQTLLAANAARRSLLVQNNDAAQVMRVTVEGTVPTATVGFRVQPGDSLSFDSFAPTGAIKAIMEVATATANNVESTEG